MSDTTSIDDLDDATKAMFAKLLDKKLTTKYLKPICLAAIQINSKAGVRRALGKKIPVYLEDYLDGDNRLRTRAWRRCTRYCYKPEGSTEYKSCCFKHYHDICSIIFAAMNHSPRMRLATFEDPYLKDKMKVGLSLAAETPRARSPPEETPGPGLPPSGIWYKDEVELSLAEETPGPGLPLAAETPQASSPPEETPGLPPSGIWYKDEVELSLAEETSRARSPPPAYEDVVQYYNKIDDKIINKIISIRS